MKHLGTVFLETERLVLRPFCMEDAPAAFRNWTSDPAVTRFLRWPAHKDLSITEMILEDWIGNYQRKDFYQWAIVPKDLSEPIGTISVVDMDERIGMVHIGYCIGQKWWKQGYTSEAFSRLITFFFDEMDVNRVESQHDPDNPGSGMVMRKCGLVYEGTRRQGDFNNQGIVDAALYAILRTDYEKRKG